MFSFFVQQKGRSLKSKLKRAVYLRLAYQTSVTTFTVAMPGIYNWFS